jgi:hypothetical protein
LNAELVAHTKPLIQLGEVVSRIERCRILTCADFRSRIRDREKLGIDGGEIVMTPAVFYLVWSKLLKKVRFLTMGPSSVAAY